MFKNKKTALAILFAAVFLFSPLVSLAESIKSFDVKVDIQDDASFKVRETIVYDFGEEMRHGIYRDIPFLRSDKYFFSRHINIRNVWVEDEYGNSYPFEFLRMGDYKRIKIGDPETLITGEHTYNISYEVERAFLYHDEFDEWYWNVTGDNWQVPIESSSLVLAFPEVIAPSKLKENCYYGFPGSNAFCLNALPASENKNVVTSSRVYSFTEALSPGQGITMSVAFPKGIIYEPSIFGKMSFFILDNWFVLLLMLLPFVIFGICFARWERYGKDPEGRGTILPQYDVPENLIPLEVASILREKVSGKDISAEMIQLAILGYVRIERIEADQLIGKKVEYNFIKLKEGNESLHPAQKELLLRWFGLEDKVSLESLKYKFHSDISDIRKIVNDDLVRKGFYDSNPDKARWGYRQGILVGVIALFLLIGFFRMADVFEFALLFISVALSGIILFIFSILMPKKTIRGVEAKEHLLGLKRYLDVVEKDRINFHNAPQKSPELFEKFLPVAIVMGVEKAWAREFEGIYTEPPTWYAGNWAAFSAVNFTHDIDNFVSTSSSAITVMPSSGGSGSGGGGSSGGGFGGGGGGSW